MNHFLLVTTKVLFFFCLEKRFFLTWPWSCSDQKQLFFSCFPSQLQRYAIIFTVITIYITKTLKHPSLHTFIWMSAAFQWGRSLLRSSKIPRRGSCSSIWMSTWRSWFPASETFISISKEANKCLDFKSLHESPNQEYFVWITAPLISPFEMLHKPVSFRAKFGSNQYQMLWTRLTKSHCTLCISLIWVFTNPK